jgi:hypothetical protein
MASAPPFRCIFRIGCGGGGAGGVSLLGDRMPYEGLRAIALSHKRHPSGKAHYPHCASNGGYTNGDAKVSSDDLALQSLQVV